MLEKNFKSCFTEDCGGVFAEEIDNELYCEKCSQIFCATCKIKKEIGHLCDDYAQKNPNDE